MIVVAGTLGFPGEHHDAVAAIFAEAVAITHTEKGCLTYDLWAHTSTAGLFLVFEEWETLADLEAHLAAPHLLAMREQLGPLGPIDRDIARYEVTNKTNF